MTPAHIRPLVPADLDAFYDVFESVAAEGIWIGTEVPFDREERRARTLEGLADGTTIFLVAEVGGDIVGGLGMHLVIPGLWDLGMFLASDFRGQGVGSALMERCLELARERGAYKLTLQVWPHNEPALRLYEKFGFEREGYLRRQWRRRNGEIWDAIVMGLVLDEAG